LAVEWGAAEADVIPFVGRVAELDALRRVLEG